MNFIFKDYEVKDNFSRSSWLSERSLRRLLNLVAMMKVDNSAVQVHDHAENVTDGLGDMGERSQVVTVNVSFKRIM